MPSSAFEEPAGFHLVRFHERITDEARALVIGAGLQIAGYEPGNAYLVWGTAQQADRASALRPVRSVRPVPAGRKTATALLGPGSEVKLFDVTFHRQALAPVLDLLDRAEAVRTMSPVRAGGSLRTARVSLPASSLERVVAHPAVLFVSPAVTRVDLHDELTDQILAGNLNPEGTQPVPGYAPWLEALGLSGSGTTVAVVDTGITDHHPDLLDKVVDRHAYGGPVSTSGHGTVVGHIVAGDPPLGDLPSDINGFAFGYGVAPDAALVDQKALDGLTAFSIGPYLARDAWRSGARIQNNSWGAAPEDALDNGYVNEVRLYDEMTRDADGESAGPEELLMVFSAGNDGAEGIQIPQEAKNIIAVGATESGRILGNDYVSQAPIDRVADFSTRGPTTDGRVFPTVSAPGNWVVGARGPEMTFNIAFWPCPPPPTGAGLYCAARGTSFSAPHGAGAAALIHQWWEREHGDLPSPAMVKALLVNGAQDIGEPDIPNPEEGWGRINLGNVFRGIPDAWEDQGLVLDGPGETTSWVVDADGSAPLRTTLAWTDAPAVVGADPALVNDLDLVVELLDDHQTPVMRWLGNVFREGRSEEGGEPDRLNNVENVFLDTPEPGRYRITVRAENVPGDGVPSNAEPTDQDFALVVRAT
jgi:subtilisin family serine protease